MTKIIMSTDRPNKSQLELHKARKEFEYYLDRAGYIYEVCEGVWQGDREQSYMISLVNGVGFTSSNGGSFVFDGINDYIDLGSWENGGAMTFSFWARWDSNHNYSRIIELGNGPSSDNIVVSQRQSNDELFFSIYLGSSETKMLDELIESPDYLDFLGVFSVLE